jgi:thiopurine S-methyltransferase
MELDYWRARWSRGEIGFHQLQPTPALVRWEQRLPAGRTLVPLCGKSLDLGYLAGQGRAVVGVEVALLALESFFAEAGILPTRREEGSAVILEGAGITGLAADFLAVSDHLLGRFEAVFDRGALVALPPEVRTRYAARCLDLLAPGGKILLIGFEYDPAKMNGPPFAIDEAEVHRLYGARAAATRLERREILEEEPRFKARGLDWLAESAWLIEPR